MKTTIFLLFALILSWSSSRAYADCLKFVPWDSNCLTITLSSQNSSTDLNNPSIYSFAAEPQYNILLLGGIHGTQVPGSTFVYYDANTRIITRLVTAKATISFANTNGQYCIYPPTQYATNPYAGGPGTCVYATSQNSAISDCNSACISSNFSVSADGHLLRQGSPVPGDKFYIFDPLTQLSSLEIYVNGGTVSQLNFIPVNYPPNTPSPTAVYDYEFSNCSQQANNPGAWVCSGV